MNGRIITDHNDDKDNDDEEEENVTDEEDHLEAEDEAEGEGDAAEDERGERQDESAQSRTVGWRWNDIIKGSKWLEYNNSYGTIPNFPHFAS